MNYHPVLSRITVTKFLHQSLDKAEPCQIDTYKDAGTYSFVVYGKAECSSQLCLPEAGIESPVSLDCYSRGIMYTTKTSSGSHKSYRN